jgi:hypothetical protein
MVNFQHVTLGLNPMASVMSSKNCFYLSGGGNSLVWSYSLFFISFGSKISFKYNIITKVDSFSFCPYIADGFSTLHVFYGDFLGNPLYPIGM